MKKKVYSVILLVISLIHLITFYILLTMAFKDKADLSSKWAFPKSLYLDNFVNAWKSANMGRAFLNNIIIHGDFHSFDHFIQFHGSISAGTEKNETEYLCLYSNHFLYDRTCTDYTGSVV